MKKNVLLLILFVICFSVNAQSWGADFRDVSKYTKFTEKCYRIINKTNIYDEDSNIVSSVHPHQSFRSSKFAYVYHREEQRFIDDDIFVSFKEGWISVDDLVLEKSDILPASIVLHKNELTNKRWFPIWFNSMLDSGRTLEESSNYYKRYKGSPEYELLRIHEIEFRNTVLTFFDTSDKYSFSIQNIKKNNNVYYIKCELDKSRQSYFNDFDKESFLNLPDLTVDRNAVFIIEPNGNRLRVYNGENHKLIVEFMLTNLDWMNLMVKYIKSEYKNKPSNLKVIEERLEHPWSNPVTGLYDNSVRSGEPVAVNVALNKTMTVKDNLRLRSSGSTAGKSIVTIGKGTQVEVLAVGAEQTIDGIVSNWVQVEVQAGAKDRDGKPIAAGTTGWCFGGYLGEKPDIGASLRSKLGK